jgi:hypothetical protein
MRSLEILHEDFDGNLPGRKEDVFPPLRQKGFSQSIFKPQRHKEHKEKIPPVRKEGAFRANKLSGK